MKTFAAAIFALFCGLASVSVASAHNCQNGYSSGGYSSYDGASAYDNSGEE